MMKQAKTLLHLKLIDGVGDVSIKRLIDNFQDCTELNTLTVDEIANTTGLNTNTVLLILKGLADKSTETKVEKILETLIKKQIHVITGDNSLYPAQLKEIAQPPLLLFLWGNTELLKDEMLAVVGTRRPSHYGIYATQKIVSELIDYGFGVVSGLAKGIDSLAHQTALKNRGKTIAVLGCGIDIIYPSENRDLFRALVRDGLIVSEYPPGTAVHQAYFPLRNRIISGLTYGTLVIEASLKSGTLITAQAALDQSREVFAVPGPISSINSFGTNQLIKQGAKLVQSVDDILEEFTYLNLKSRSTEKERVRLTSKEELIYNVLVVEAADIDHLLNKTGLEFNEIYQYLLTMQLKGLVNKLPGGRYMLKA